MAKKLADVIQVEARAKAKNGTRGNRGTDLQKVLRERIARQEIPPGSKLREN